MTAGDGALPAPAVVGPSALLETLRENAGSVVDGASLGSPDGAPDVSALTEARGAAVLAAWTGARLHAGLPGLLRADDADLSLLVGDWSYAHALQALAHDGDLEAIGVLAAAIGDCALLLAQEPGAPDGFSAIWRAACAVLALS